ncbi:amidohydrolase [Allofournierella sp.]|uniref:amidohydrolase n=1 Tax=Allofournierella sp. TaxID=1940256 RepID=UPI003AB31EE7
MPFAEALQAEYAWLHRHPELSFEEHAATAHLRAELEALGARILGTGLETGLVAELKGGRPGPTLALRADLDALPLAEDPSHTLRSEAEGRMHACGHDFHAAALLGAAALLAQRKAELAGRVLLVFQPGEESGRGALQVLATGALEGASAIFGLHLLPGLAPGAVGLTEGANFAAIGRFSIELQGRGCHAAQPHAGADCVLAAARLAESLQSVVSRNVDPMHPAVVSVTRIQAGNTWNVLPGAALLEGTTRCFSASDDALIARRVQEICQGVAAACGVSARLTWPTRHPATDNAPALIARARAAAGAEGIPCVPAAPTLLGEDFAFYQQKLPGAFLTFGLNSAPLHHPAFAADPAALEPAARLLARLALLPWGAG